MESGTGVITILVFIFVYFLPAIIAGGREHHQGGSIFALNLFLGWTFMGWIAAFIWSVSSTEGKKIK